MPSCPWKLVDVRADPIDLADQYAQHVDVVDAVLEQRARSGERAIAAPCGLVVTLDRDELIVAEDDAPSRCRRQDRR